MKKTIISLLACAASVVYIQANTPTDIQQKVDSILATMSLEQKIGQMNQLNCDAMDDALFAMAARGEVGSILNAPSLADINRLQRAAMEGCGVPIVFARDVIHGYHTIFPIPLGQAATFNPAIIEKGAQVAALEATSEGIRWTFAPMLDIARDPRWGRIAESLGEDPYLAATLGAAMVRGFQGQDYTSPTSMAACAKHFVGYGAAEGGRDYNTTAIGPLSLRNTYLPPFKAAIDAGALTVMSSFNANDGIPSTANRPLLRDFLRGELGFDGTVVSDWNAVDELITHGVAADGSQAAQMAVNAGVDFDMNTRHYLHNLKQLVAEGKVSESDIDNAVRNILTLKMQLGLFDNPYTTPLPSPIHYAPDHLEAAQQAAEQAVVMLKNDNHTLPLKPGARVAVFGPLADDPYNQMGTWVLDGEAEHSVTPLTSIRAYSAAHGGSATYEPAMPSSLSRETPDARRIAELMGNADVAVVFVGEESRLSGEAHSLSDLNLTGAQSELLRMVKTCGKPVVAVVLAGRPLTIGRDLPNADALLYSFHPGTMGGPAICRLLYGEVSPSGKLPVTIPAEPGQIPLYYNHENTGRPAPEDTRGILYAGADGTAQTSAGDVSRYLDSGNTPLFPFGFGLTYTTFEYSKARLSSDTLAFGDSITVNVDITNTGSHTAREIAQLYVRDCVASIARPVRELKGFQSITLAPGEIRTLTFILTPADLAFTHPASQASNPTSTQTTTAIQTSSHSQISSPYIREAEPGDFLLGIGPDSTTPLTTPFTLHN